MDDQPPRDHLGPDEGPFDIDPNVPRLARVESFLAGGHAHFAADRAAAESIGELSSGGLDGLRDMNDAIKGFVARAVTVLSSDLGIRQYLHIAMSTPTTGMVHHIATTTTELARRLGVSPATASHHVGVLRSAGLITSRRTGNSVLHHLTTKSALLPRPRPSPIPSATAGTSPRLHRSQPASAGGPGGGVQQTVSIPGTGISHTTRSRRSPGTTASRAARQQRPTSTPPMPRPTKPGLLAPKGEKQLYRAVQARNVEAMEAVAQQHPRYGLAALALAGALRFTDGQNDKAQELLGRVFATRRDHAQEPFVKKYLATRFSLEVVPGAIAELGLDRTAVGLALAELHQDAGDQAAAVEIVEQLEPMTFTGLSLAELYSQQGRHTDVVGMTEGLRNEDDATALLCTFRGVAFREQGYFEAARASFKEALKSRKRNPVIRHRALLERARTYEAESKRAMARKDLERILAEDSTYEGLADALADLAV